MSELVREIVVVRHGDALARSSWEPPDAERPLSAKGRLQADALGQTLFEDAARLGRPALFSSPALRCRETLEPLARRAGVDLEVLELLAEGSGPARALAELAELAERASDEATAGAIVACTHGDVLDGLVALLRSDGTRIAASVSGIRLETPKAGRWHLELCDGTVRAARLVGPPG